MYEDPGSPSASPAVKCPEGFSTNFEILSDLKTFSETSSLFFNLPHHLNATNSKPNLEVWHGRASEDSSSGKIRER